MSLFQVTPNVFLGNTGDFGDANTLSASGIELAVIVHGTKAFPHSATIGSIAVALWPDAAHPAWLLKGMAQLLATVYGIKIIALCDSSGGRAEAAALLAGAYAVKLQTSFNNGLVWLQSKVPDIAIPLALHNQAQSIWP